MNQLLPLLLITPVMLLLAMGIVLFMLRYQKRLYQVQEVKQRQLLEAVIEAQEAERRRVARDLHDEVGAMLALVKLNVGQVSQQPGVPPETKAMVQNAKTMLDDVMHHVRRISHNLMPVVLEKMGLPLALEAMRRSVSASSRLAVELECNDKSRRFDPKHELLLYRMVQELFSNSMKHAAATLIRVQLLFKEQEIVLTYTDNGNGFDFKAWQQHEQRPVSLGLVNLQSRVSLMHGKLDYYSAPDAGTKATIIIPYNVKSI